MDAGSKAKHDAAAAATQVGRGGLLRQLFAYDVCCWLLCYSVGFINLALKIWSTDCSQVGSYGCPQLRCAFSLRPIAPDRSAPCPALHGSRSDLARPSSLYASWLGHALHLTATTWLRAKVDCESFRHHHEYPSSWPAALRDWRVWMTLDFSQVRGGGRLAFCPPVNLLPLAPPMLCLHYPTAGPT